MERRILKNKPLVEAILEIRWSHTDVPVVVQSIPGTLGQPNPVMAVDLGPVFGTVDPYYQLLLGRFYDSVKSEYSITEALPSAQMPIGSVGRIVQQRFRTRDQWPLIQLGPGILTVNETSKYTWEGFYPRAEKALVDLYRSHPKPEGLIVQNAVLHYVNAIGIKYAETSIIEYLKKNMQVDCSLPKSIFVNSELESIPQAFQWDVSYVCKHPPGLLTMKFYTGLKDFKPSLIWETLFISTKDTLPKLPDDFRSWLEGAHTVIEDIFFKLIAGELEKGFK